LIMVHRMGMPSIARTTFFTDHVPVESHSRFIFVLEDHIFLFLILGSLSSPCQHASMEGFEKTVHSLLMAVMLALFVFKIFMVFAVAFIMKTVSSFKTLVLIARLYLILKT
jgi:hypothetical protein